MWTEKGERKIHGLTLSRTGHRPQFWQMRDACGGPACNGRWCLLHCLNRQPHLPRGGQWGAEMQGRGPLIGMKLASNSSSGIRNQPGENLVEFQTLFFSLPPSSKYQCGTSFLAGVGAVVTGCPEMKFPYLKMALRTPAKTDAPFFRSIRFRYSAYGRGTYGEVVLLL